MKEFIQIILKIYYLMVFVNEMRGVFGFDRTLVGNRVSFEWFLLLIALDEGVVFGFL